MVEYYLRSLALDFVVVDYVIALQSFQIIKVYL